MGHFPAAHPWLCPCRDLCWCRKHRVGVLRQLVIQIPEEQSQGDHAWGIMAHEREPSCRRAHGFEE